VLASALVIGAALVANSDSSPTVAAPDLHRPVAGAAGRLYRQGTLGDAQAIRPEAKPPAPRPVTGPPAPKPRAAAKPQERWYTVKRGDSLWLVANRFGTTPHVIAELNGIRPTAKLRIGQRLRIAGRAEPKAQARAAKPDNGLVETALSYRGVRYRYAGTTTRGMDCSGLVSRVLNTHGIAAPHNSRALYRLGKSVARDKLRSGDLIFFHTRGRGISHVGIYIGDGKFVHASSARGRVRVDRLDDGYYARRYVGARRVS